MFRASNKCYECNFDVEWRSVRKPSQSRQHAPCQSKESITGAEPLRGVPKLPSVYFDGISTASQE